MPAAVFPRLIALCLLACVSCATEAAAVSRRHGRRHRQVSELAEQQSLLETGAAVQEESAMTNAVDAAADLDAEAVVREAEQEAGESTQAASSFAAQTRAVQQTEEQAAAEARHADTAKDRDDEDEESNDDGDDDDDEEEPVKTMKYSIPKNGEEPVKPMTYSIPKNGEAGATSSVARPEEDAEDDKGTEVTYGVNDGVLRGESLSPQGRLIKARQRLQENLFQQTKVNTLIWEMQNETRFQSQVDAESMELRKETNAQALAMMLGGMRKEMRKFASPFYLEHLIGERNKLKKVEVVLQAELAEAEAACGKGPQGFPNPGKKVVVAGSSFRRPALRGGDSDEDSDDDEVKKLQVTIPKMESLLQQRKSERSSAPSARWAAGALVGFALLGLTL
eukprot:TRINITY_DN181_c0_g3_i1.p1 TRINITY_DN181_c0_g3~~TRINITY_DN181_c0_g3_i1.p1  ORF type:complete len:432 (+),score=130.84 TRINITY_DN181_c0_g3_i1:118-1296(+)